jgi:hypothetical protein
MKYAGASSHNWKRLCLNVFRHAILRELATLATAKSAFLSTAAQTHFGRGLHQGHFFTFFSQEEKRAEKAASKSERIHLSLSL